MEELDTLTPCKIATTFEHFPNLPKELRLLIWSFSIFGRVVNLIYDQWRDKFISFNSTVPAILHACRESRATGLKNESLKLSFGTESHKPSIYFDFARDTLFFHDWMASASSMFKTFPRQGNAKPIYYPEGPMDKNEVESIERLAVHYDFVEDKKSLCMMKLMLRNFTNIKSLYIVFDSNISLVRDGYLIISTSRAAIKFIDFPERTYCELNIQEKECEIGQLSGTHKEDNHQFSSEELFHASPSTSNIYWQADQGQLRNLRGDHGMLKFTDSVAWIEIMNPCPYLMHKVSEHSYKTHI